MQLSRAHQPVAAAAVCLVAFCASVAMFMPPLNEHTLQSVPLTILLGVATVVSFILHFIFLGIAARRLDRPWLRWIVVALLLFPVASIVGLVLFEWFSDQRNPATNESAA